MQHNFVYFQNELSYCKNFAKYDSKIRKKTFVGLAPVFGR